MTLAFFNNKGGVGKSTLAINIAFLLADMGRTVKVFDCDSQENTFSFFAENKNQPGVQQTRYKGISISKYSEETPENEYGGCDFALLDLPPALNNETQKMLAKADFVFSPIELSSFSISGIKSVINAVSRLGSSRACGEFPRFGGVIVNKFDKANTTDLEMLATVREALGGKVLQMVIPAAKPIKNSISYGKTAFEYMKWNKSVIALGELALEILERIEKE